MNARMSLTAGWKLKCLVPLLALLSAAGIAGAVDHLLIPEQLNLVFYGRGLGHTDDGLSALVLYTLPESVPDGVNVLQLRFDIDPSSLLVEGFAIMEAGALAPIQENVRNAPGKLVPICFADTGEMLAAREGGLFIEELLDLPSLKIGWADFYSEILHPTDPLNPTAPTQVNVVASGFFPEDGRSFYLHSNYSSGQLWVTFGE